MLSFHHVAGFTGLLFSILPSTSAFPTAPALAPSTLYPRAIDNYIDCSEDQQSKLGQGFADAATLARWTFDHPIDLNSAAYVLRLEFYWYRGGEGGFDLQLLISGLIYIGTSIICVQKTSSWRRISGTWFNWIMILPILRIILLFDVVVEVTSAHQEGMCLCPPYFSRWFPCNTIIHLNTIILSNYYSFHFPSSTLYHPSQNMFFHVSLPSPPLLLIQCSHYFCLIFNILIPH